MDPLESRNRSIYAFNESLDEAILEPAADGYDYITPNMLQKGVNNFFYNINYPVTIINQLLQGNIEEALQDTLRFSINSSIGVFGLFDPASSMGLSQHDEDFGQTLAVWGVKEGPYLMLPFIGPKTLRSLTGDFTDILFNPLLNINDTNLKIKAYSISILQDRSDLSTLEEELDNSFDPYQYIKDSYFQNRTYKIHNGVITEDDEEVDFDFDDF
ncbi:MAG TPA: VacJ family lipoprotein [Gammaproteobacteria bacterium]|nr:VacJ family lipoprotein [Gammaproteobacteria bacterium]